MNKVAELRKKLDLTQAELAEKIGLKQPRISAWESGKLQPTQRDTMAIESLLREK